MPILTLARYVLENSLMEYETVALSDSILASASLYLALQMKKTGGWTETLEFYTGNTLLISNFGTLIQICGRV